MTPKKEAYRYLCLILKTPSAQFLQAHENQHKIKRQPNKENPYASYFGALAPMVLNNWVYVQNQAHTTTF
ncbi:MAG: hypothetical protein ABSA75_12370 [Candidatus Bathyarchaeia archaeon]